MGRNINGEDESRDNPPVANFHHETSLSARLERAVLWKQPYWKGVPPLSRGERKSQGRWREVVKESLVRQRLRFGAAQEKSNGPRDQPPRNDDALPNKARRQNQWSGCAERREKRHEGGFAHPDAALRERQYSGELGERPGKEPDAQRQN